MNRFNITFRIAKTTILSTLAALSLTVGATTAFAVDPYTKNLENRRYWDAYDARNRESKMSMDDWTKMVVGGYGHKAKSGSAAPSPYVAPRPAAQPVNPATSKAARDAHNRELYEAALRRMGR